VAEALDLGAEYGDDAKFLAGGHSLLAAHKAAAGHAEVLIDLRAGPGAELVRQEDGHVRDRGADPPPRPWSTPTLLARSVPLLAHARASVATRRSATAARSRVAGAQRPASDLPAQPCCAGRATLVA